jgi:hypothetical protein
VPVGPVAALCCFTISKKRYCSGHAPTEPDAATREMLAASLRPLEPYPGKAAAPWRCECLRCGDVVIARLQKIRSGQRCCQRRGVAASALARSADPGASDAMMRTAMLEPLEPYPGGTSGRGRGGCLACGVINGGLKQRTPPDLAEARLRAGGFERPTPSPRGQDRDLGSASPPARLVRHRAQDPQAEAGR